PPRSPPCTLPPLCSLCETCWPRRKKEDRPAKACPPREPIDRRFLLVAKRHDRIELRRPPGRPQAEEDADARREAEREHDGLGRDGGLPLRRALQDLGAAETR